MEDAAMQERVGRIEGLLDEIETLPDPHARATATEAVQALVELYGEGLTRILETVFALGGAQACAALAADDLVAHLLLLHGLHPVDIETRIHGALEEVRPYLNSHGGDVDLVGVEAGIARLRLRGTCGDCPASTLTLKLAVEQAILRAAPDLLGIEAEDDFGVIKAAVGQK